MEKFNIGNFSISHSVIHDDYDQDTDFIDQYFEMLINLLNQPN